MTRRKDLRPRRGRRNGWFAVGCLALAAAALAAPLQRLLADGAGPDRGAEPVLRFAQVTETNRAGSATTARPLLPVFARLRPDLATQIVPSARPSTIPAELEAALAPPTNARRADLRLSESLIDPGLNTRALPRPGDAPVPEKEQEELRQRLRPGFALPAPYKVPFVHTDVIAPHLTPDVEVAVSDRTKLGVFGQVGPAGDAKSVPFPGIINRPLGAGVTLEYRFGTR